ncbi:hypothetical protein [Pseudoalteromonas denitrificans]|uniref:Uncharacterized protein n=1 Tax=Pseudoalteromonas denitrificans DSM 6059 TaxID=1123010 RepID=A0A1I1UJ84_9GAMM|nr:hypothetical protein [Pseudoalteromonas denitrificans]SFD68020.1 hypothetical protein SAMN02745724_05176 [Pseudoalteromonas denitrificans DSM 6059]
MKLACISIVLLLTTLIMSHKTYSKNDFPVIAERYLGQKPPGLTPKFFAPDIVSTQDHRETEVLFSPDMR